MKLAYLAAAAAAFAGVSAADATTYPIGSSNFFITSGSATPTSVTPSVSAVFYNGFDNSTSFDDSYTFRLPASGVGSGSLSTSFSGSDRVTISALYINGTSYPITGQAAGQVATVGGVPITAFDLNTIRIVGSVSGSGSYSGTATFTTATGAVPEPASWAMFIGGFGLVGGAMRQRKTKLRFA